jgi:hypothetical protein
MKLSLINPLFFHHERVVGFLLPTNGDLDGREAVQLHCNENARTECSQRQEDTDFALPMLAVSTKGGFCYASLQVEGKEVLPFTFSSQSTGTSLWFHWMWLNAQHFNELESMLECIHCRARKLLSDTWLARAEVNKMTDFFRRLPTLG